MKERKMYVYLVSEINLISYELHNCAIFRYENDAKEYILKHGRDAELYEYVINKFVLDDWKEVKED